jgi:CHAD domain-containing protein
VNVSTYVAPELRSLVEKLHAVRPRLVLPKADAQAHASEAAHEADAEALHDLRVGLRRLRALLRPLGVVYGKKRVKAARAALKTIGDASSTLRDEEVLEDLLRSLNLPPPAARGLARWLDGRAASTRRERADFIKQLDESGLDAAIASVAALIEDDEPASKPKRSRRGGQREVIPFATKVVQKAQKELGTIAISGPDDAVGLHELRIGYKHLRYAIDGFARALPPELVAMREIAVGLQKRLGDLHDLDVALEAIKNASGLAKTHQDAVHHALKKKRHKALQKFVAEAGSRADGWPQVHAPPPAPSQAPLPQPPTGLPSRG